MAYQGEYFIERYGAKAAEFTPPITRMLAAGVPVVRVRRPSDRRSRIQLWNDTVGALAGLQGEYAEWLEALPGNQQDSALAEALRAIVDLDLSELQAIEPPRGFGRD